MNEGRRERDGLRRNELKVESWEKKIFGEEILKKLIKE